MGYGYGWLWWLGALRSGGRAAPAGDEEDGRLCARRASTSSRSRSTAARSPRRSGARRGATTWSRSATSRTACRAAAPTSATARSATWRSPRARSRPRSPARNSTPSRSTSRRLPPKKWKAVEAAVQRADRLAVGTAPRPALGPRDGGRDRPARGPVSAARSEISLQCSCPDWAVMCKHVAAVLYGVGARLDTKPELLFHAPRREPRGADRGRRRKGRGGGHLPREVQAAGGGRDRRRLWNRT